MNVLRRQLWALMAGWLLAGAMRLAGATIGPPVFDVRQYGAVGDGITLDTRGINAAIEACAQAGGGEVLFPAGRYLSGTVRLRSHLTLVLSAGARLVGTTNLSEYTFPASPSELPESRWGKWHRGLLVGENLEDVTILGPGIIDGRQVTDPTGEEKMRGPHGVVFVNCHRFEIRNLEIIDAANYAIYFEVSDDVDVRNVRIIGGWDGVHWRGGPERWCKNVHITGCQFFTGDDAIAGRYWDGAVISGCLINSSCNGVRLIGPATHLLIDDCLFYGPGEQPHRTSGALRRTNMLSGIILQPGAWDRTHGLLDDVLISRVAMKNVASPVTLWTKPGNTVGRVTIQGLDASGVYRSAFSAESWGDSPLTNVVLRNATIEFIGAGQAEQARQIVKGPAVDARPLPAWGFYARNVQNLTLEDVRLTARENDYRPVGMAESVGVLTLDNFRFTPGPPGVVVLASTNIGRLIWQDPWASPK